MYTLGYEGTTEGREGDIRGGWCGGETRYAALRRCVMKLMRPRGDRAIASRLNILDIRGLFVFSERATCG